MIEPKKKDRFLGRAVQNGVIRFSSVSQIKTFDPDTDGGCNRKWAYPYLFGIRLPRTKAQEGGSTYAEELEHYLTTGEDVLSPVLRPAKKYFPEPGPDLECEQYLGDMEKALALRDAAASPALVEGVAGIALAGVPVDGAADCRHARGCFVDSDGIMKADPSNAFVIHVDDLKTTSRIYPHKILSGASAGNIIPSYAKTDAEVCEDIQMIVYGRHAINKYPGMTHMRASLIYAGTKKREAAKRTGLVSVEQILERTRSIENIVEKMKQVATAQRIEDIEPNTSACDSYTHVDPSDPTKTLKGCGYRYQCPLHHSQVVNHMLGPYKESAMSLFDQILGTASVTAPAAPAAPIAPPVDAQTHDRQVEEARLKLLAEMSPGLAITAPIVPAATAPMVSYGFCIKCGTALTSQNASKSRTSDVVTHIGCTAVVTSSPPAPMLPIAINPPDRPPAPDLLAAAAPLPAAEIAQIIDPELREKVEQHARDHAAKAAAEAARAEAEKVANGTAIWCPGGQQKLIVTSDMSVEGYTCACGKHWTIKALKPVKENDSYVTNIPRHKPKGDEKAAVAVTAPTLLPGRTGTNIFVATPDGGRRELTVEEVAIVTGEAPPPPAAPSTPPVAPPIPVNTAAPQPPTPLAPPVPTIFIPSVTAPIVNGNGTHKASAPETLAVRQDMSVFRVKFWGGRIISVIASSLENAMVRANSVCSPTDGKIQSFEELQGDVVGNF